MRERLVQVVGALPAAHPEQRRGEHLEGWIEADVPLRRQRSGADLALDLDENASMTSPAFLSPDLTVNAQSGQHIRIASLIFATDHSFDFVYDWHP